MDLVARRLAVVTARTSGGGDLLDWGGAAAYAQ